jgi:hypothetical protein
VIRTLLIDDWMISIGRQVRSKDGGGRHMMASLVMGLLGLLLVTFAAILLVLLLLLVLLFLFLLLVFLVLLLNSADPCLISDDGETCFFLFVQSKYLDRLDVGVAGWVLAQFLDIPSFAINHVYLG